MIQYAIALSILCVSHASFAGARCERESRTFSATHPMTGVSRTYNPALSKAFTKASKKGYYCDEENVTHSEYKLGSLSFVSVEVVCFRDICPEDQFEE